MKLGVYNAILHDRPLPEALKVIADLGLTGIEINTGGFLPAVHVPTFNDILESDAARDDYLAVFEGTGVSIAGLNCNGNPLHPNRAIGEKHAEDIRRSIRLAHRLGQNRVVTMSGLPGGEPGATTVNWVVNAWNSAALDVLDYQWGVAAKFWKETDRLAADHDVKVALELHPQNIVFNTADVYKLIDLTGATHVGVELDASHLFWQQMDPVAVVRELGPLVFQAAAKDVRVNTENAALYGVLDNSFRRLSPEENRTNLGGDEWANEWPKNSAWDFVALGRGHDTAFWTEFPARAARGGPGHAGQHRTRGHLLGPHRGPRSGSHGPAGRGRSAVGGDEPDGLTVQQPPWKQQGGDASLLLPVVRGFPTDKELKHAHWHCWIRSWRQVLSCSVH
ncbi:sugar phosphate isomerase/epimerase [Arthrobacter sp. V1I9]|nr:sugar phosphate isomerase/epimerase [Arthrobacter sp. V1I9]